MKNILITGCNGELGKEVLIYALNKGFNVVGTDRKSSSDDSNNDNYKFYEVDLSDEVAVNNLFKKDFSDHTFDIAIFLHGLIHSKSMFNSANGDLITLKEWDDVFHSNLRSNFILTREMLANQIKRRFPIHLIYVSSIASKGFAGQAAYSSAKAGLEGFSKVISKEYGGLGIRSNCIAPGFMETELLKENISESRLNYIKNNSSLRSLVKVSDLIKGIDFLIHSETITGTNLIIDSGFEIR
jgi:3-oxoacyl-[acyl-carrier protein] reductase